MKVQETRAMTLETLLDKIREERVTNKIKLLTQFAKQNTEAADSEEHGFMKGYHTGKANAYELAIEILKDILKDLLSK